MDYTALILLIIILNKITAQRPTSAVIFLLF